MEIVFGLKPTLQPRNPGKYAELWTALHNAAPGEWLALRVADLIGKTPAIAKANLWQAAKKVHLRIESVIEGELVYIRLKSTPAPTPKPTKKSLPAPPPAPPLTPALKAIPDRQTAPGPSQDKFQISNYETEAVARISSLMFPEQGRLKPLSTSSPKDQA
jgi:hypothetical protein